MEQNQHDWKNMNGREWSELLREQPQFADKCDWANLEEEEWDSLSEEQPQFAAYRTK